MILMEILLLAFVIHIITVIVCEPICRSIGIEKPRTKPEKRERWERW